MFTIIEGRESWRHGTGGAVWRMVKPNNEVVTCIKSLESNVLNDPSRSIKVSVVATGFESEIAAMNAIAALKKLEKR